MHYFIGGALNENITGIERAQINRLKLFKEMHLETRLVFTKPNPWMYFYAKKFGIEDACLSVYGYFQETLFNLNTENANTTPIFYDNFSKEMNCSKTQDGIKYYNHEKQLYKYAAFHKNTEILSYVNNLDYSGKLVSRDFYDIRGFVDKTKYFSNLNGTQVYLEQFYSPSGEVKIERYFTNDNKDESTLKYITLKNHKGCNYRFKDESQLFSFFIDDIHQDDNIYYTDRHYDIDNILGEKNVNVVSVLHNIHTVRNKNTNQIMTSSLTRNYKYSLEHSNNFQRIIVSTDWQKRDIEQRFPKIKNVSVIPVAYTEESYLDNLYNINTNPLRLISVARYHSQKQLEHQLRLIQKLKVDFPNIELHMFGFGNTSKLEYLIKYMEIESNVFIRGFKKDLENEYKQSLLSLCTSSFEGFCLAVFESIKFNVPCISYDIRYGPNEIISNNVNGYLIEPNNEELLYIVVKDYINKYKNERLTMTENFRFKQKFSKETIKKTWSSIIQSIY